MTAPHGTLQGYWKHYRGDLPACDPCRKAQHDHWVDIRPPLDPSRLHRDDPIPHGTPKGYAAHYSRSDLPACEPCVKAAQAARQIAAEVAATAETPVPDVEPTPLDPIAVRGGAHEFIRRLDRISWDTRP